jgi:hypothetical protein
VRIVHERHNAELTIGNQRADGIHYVEGLSLRCGDGTAHASCQVERKYDIAFWNGSWQKHGLVFRYGLAWQKGC